MKSFGRFMYMGPLWGYSHVWSTTDPPNYGAVIGLNDSGEREYATGSAGAGEIAEAQRLVRNRMNSIRMNEQDTDSIVAEFHEAFGYPVRDVPTVPCENEVRLRLRLIAEEFIELLEAHAEGSHPWIDEIRDELTEFINGKIDPAKEVNLPAVADALADLDYVIAGTRLTYGIPGRAVFDEVHASNLAKVGGTVDEHGKLQKPEGWKPPDIEGALRRHGWEPTDRGEGGFGSTGVR